jgi:pimeloyl-ACP methyl ester carboxylesterase
MGGTTVVRAAPGTGVAAVVEEAGYADLPLLLGAAIPRIARLPRVFVPGVLLAGRLWPDFDAWAVRPEWEASKLWEEGVPLYVAHSTGDGLIPVEHAKKFAVAHPNARVWILQDYDHVEAFAHPEYEERLRSFLGTIAAERRPDPST